MIDQLIEQIKADKENLARYLKHYPSFFEILDRYFKTLWINPDLVRPEN